MADPNGEATPVRQRQWHRLPTGKPNGNDREEEIPQIELWNMGEDHSLPPPREWLLGRTFCRGFVSGLAAGGGTGKTAMRIVQAMAVATGRDLTGERVYGRFRTLYVALEDNLDEIRRRVWAAAKHHDISHDELLDCFYMATPMGMKVGEASHENPRDVVPGLLERWLRAVIRETRIDLLVLDPFVKIHTSMKTITVRSIRWSCCWRGSRPNSIAPSTCSITSPRVAARPATPIDCGEPARCGMGSGYCTL